MIDPRSTHTRGRGHVDINIVGSSNHPCRKILILLDLDVSFLGFGFREDTDIFASTSTSPSGSQVHLVDFVSRHMPVNDIAIIHNRYHHITSTSASLSSTTPATRTSFFSHVCYHIWEPELSLAGETRRPTDRLLVARPPSSGTPSGSRKKKPPEKLVDPFKSRCT